MFFWNSLAFSVIQWMLAILSLVPLPFLNPAWTSRCSWFTDCWNLTWRILSISLLPCEMSAIVCLFEHSLALPFFGIGMKTDLFQSCGHCWVFQICWHTDWSTFTTSSFRIWNSSTGIPSPPLALFVFEVGLAKKFVWVFFCKTLQKNLNELYDQPKAELKNSGQTWTSGSIFFRRVGSLWAQNSILLPLCTSGECNRLSLKLPSLTRTSFVFLVR